MRVAQMAARFFGFYRPYLRHDDAGDDLKTVADSVLHFAKQDVFLPKQLVLFSFQEASAGDVLDAEQDVCARALLVEYLAGVEKHRAMPDIRKVVLDFAALHHTAFGENFAEQGSKLRCVPFTVTKVVKQLALDVARVEGEGTIERAAARNAPTTH